MSKVETATFDDAEVRDVETSRRYFDAGMKAELNGDRIEAVKAYEAAYTADPDDPATWGKVSRNKPCPCGSGKKYKHCHGRH